MKKMMLFLLQGRVDSIEPTKANVKVFCNAVEDIQKIAPLVKKDSIPHLRLGPKTIRFTENQVERLENSLDSSLVKASPPLNNE